MSSTAHPHQAHQRTDPEGLTLDPHGEHGEHHGHIIVSFWTLTSVLLILLAFTVLTVAASRTEIWASETFGIAIPQWVNIVVALSIAVVKGTLVLLFFMQLKYDNKVNAVIFSACLFCVALFLGFSMIDLGSRGTIYAWKTDPLLRGGSGVMLHKVEIDPATGEPRRNAEGDPITVPVNGPIVAFARDRYIAEHGLEAWTANAAIFRGHGHAAREEPEKSDANKSRPRRGLTPGLFDEHDADPAGGHGSGH